MFCEVFPIACRYISVIDSGVVIPIDVDCASWSVRRDRVVEVIESTSHHSPGGSDEATYKDTRACTLDHDFDDAESAKVARQLPAADPSPVPSLRRVRAKPCTIVLDRALECA